MTTRAEALERIVGIARDHGLTAAEIAGALGRDAAAAGPASGNLLGRILAYLGGIFVFAGIGVFIALNWDAMNPVARIVVSLGSGLAALVMALVALREVRYEWAVTPLLLIAVILQPTGILVTIDELATGGDWHYAVLVASGVTALQQAGLFARYRRAVSIFTALLFSLWFFATVLDLLDMDPEWIALLLGAATVGFCTGLERTPYRDIVPFWYFVGGAGALGGLFGIVEGTSAELVFVPAACGGVFVSVQTRSRTLLVVSTIAILGYVSYYTSEHFLESYGWPLALIVLGIVLILLSALALRINRRYLRRP
jgi:Predicted membrane protein (DUF2157)